MKITKSYDLIVCNPPYFENSLHSPSDARTQARHNINLSYEELFECVTMLLSEKGHFAIIIPLGAMDKVSYLANKHQLFLIRKTEVCTTPTSGIKRYLLEYSKQYKPLREDTIVIEEKRHQYTTEYKTLTDDFYL